jgi:CPA2 family monovalent cation:H+ antiporter-2
MDPETRVKLRAPLAYEDFAMAIYLPVLAVMAAGGTWWQALLGVLVAVGALLMALLASRGHRIGAVLSHPESEQLLLRVLGITLLVAALAELINISAAVEAFLVGLSLTGGITDRARDVLTPLRDLFAAAFFLPIGLSVNTADLLPVLPAALALAVITAVAKVLAGVYAAGRDGVDRRGRLRVGTALIARGEFSIVVVGLVGTAADPRPGALVAAYVLIFATTGPSSPRSPTTRFPVHQALDDIRTTPQAWSPTRSVPLESVTASHDRHTHRRFPVLVYPGLDRSGWAR